VNETGRYAELEDPSHNKKPVQNPNFRYSNSKVVSSSSVAHAELLVAKLSARAGIIPECLNASHF